MEGHRNHDRRYPLILLLSLERVAEYPQSCAEAAQVCGMRGIVHGRPFVAAQVCRSARRGGVRRHRQYWYKARTDASRRLLGRRAGPSYLTTTGIRRGGTLTMAGRSSNNGGGGPLTMAEVCKAGYGGGDPLKMPGSSKASLEASRTSRARGVGDPSYAPHRRITSVIRPAESI